jgi:hypothetical protein
VSKLAKSSKGLICAFCSVPVLAIIAIALLSVSPSGHRGAAGRSVSASAASQPAAITPGARSRIQASYAKLPLAFEKNQGQTDGQVQYMARGNGYTLFLTANDAVFSLRSRSAGTDASAVRRGAALRPKNPSRQRDADKNLTAVVHMQLVGGSSLAKVTASDQLPGKANYFLGNDQSKWRTDVARYARVSYQDLYPGVNLAFHGAQRQTEFDFVVAPGANPAPIGFRFTGAQAMNTDDSGNLVISSAAGNVLLHKPVAYQQQGDTRQIVDARFILKANHQAGFELGNYDRSRELVIDPSVSYEYSTYLGGSAEDDGYGIAFDGNGNAYVTGQTQSTNFPGASNSNAGGFDVFVTKMDANGSSLVYSTYVGGSGDDSGNSIAVDASGDAFVAGGTTSSNFPTKSAFQGTSGGGGLDAFVFELSPSGGSFNYSTYLGGSGADVALGIALDSSGNAYVTGSTESTNFPLASALQRTYGTNTDAFVTKLNPAGSALVYSTYLGGSGSDVGGSIAVDFVGNAYVAGFTASTDFPTTGGAKQTTYGGGTDDAFVTVINSSGSGYVYSTYLGGSGSDVGDGIAVDASGNAYVTGDTESTDFPTTAGAKQTGYGGNTDAFVTKLNPAGNAFVYSTYLGGSGFDAGAGIAVDENNNAYVTGQTASANFPTANPTQSVAGGSNDAFVTEINSAGSALVFSTFLGGSMDEDDGGDFGSIAVDNAGVNIYVTGNTLSTDFPTHVPFQAASGGGGVADAFVVKYAQGPTFNIVATTPTGVAPGTPGTSTVTLTSYNGYNSAVNLTCSVAGSGATSPSCSVTGTNPVTPVASPGTTSAVTITTTGPSAALILPGKMFYAMFLPVAGLSLIGMGFSSAGSRRKKLMGFLMIGMVLAALSLMPACGGSSGNGGGGGGCPTCTPAGGYTVTITGTGTDANATVETAQIILTVN